MSIQPCCLDSGESSVNSAFEISTSDKCCSNEGGGESQDLPSKSCSPFFGCCASSGFIFTSNLKITSLSPSFLKEVSLPKYKDLYHFELVTCILQPPQFIS